MNRNLRYGLFAAVLVMVGMLVGFQLKDGESEQRRQELNSGLQKFQEAVLFVERNYVKVPDTKAWIDALPKLLGCENTYSSQQPATPTDPTAWYAVTCDVERDGKNFNVSVRTLFLEFGGYTTVQVTQW